MDSKQNNAKAYDQIVEEMSGADGTSQDARTEHFVNAVEALHAQQRGVILAFLEANKIDTVQKLNSAFDKGEISLEGGIIEIGEQEDAAAPQLGEIFPVTADSVGILLNKDVFEPKLLRALLKLTPEQQVEALSRAGVRVSNQLRKGDQIQGQRIVNAIGTVLSGIAPEAGMNDGTISTPMGGKAKPRRAGGRG